MSDYNPYSLGGKTILVTGASSGIGRETAIQCSKLGAKVIITARNAERLNETFSQLDGKGHSMMTADLTEPEGKERVLGGIDKLNGVVLCAGKGLTSPFPFSTRDKFNDVFDVNFFAPVELLRLFIKTRRIEKDSSVVFVSSIGGTDLFSPGNGVYGASKAALNSIMKYCAKELASKRIRVNSVNPGMVNTKLIQNGAFSEEQQRVDMEKYPLKRYGEPIDIALGIVYLLSEASSWVTGHSLVIDGGITI